MKKHVSLILALALALGALLSPAALAEATHADDFFSGLSQAWNGLVGMAEDAGQAASDWANESGVAAWIEDARSDIAAWADDSGLTAWVQGALSDIAAWSDDSGFTDWTQYISSNVEAFVYENGPEIQKWLENASDEVKNAWYTLVNATEHSQEELLAALKTVSEALNDEDDN